MLDRKVIAVLMAAALMAGPGCQRPPSSADSEPQGPESAPQAHPQGEVQADGRPLAPIPAAAGQTPEPAGESGGRESTPVPSTQREGPRPASGSSGDIREEARPGTGSSARTQEAPAPVEPAAPEIVTLPSGTVIEIEMLDGVSSATSQAGDAFRAKVAAEVRHDGRAVIPQGAVVSGTVTEAKRLAKIGGRARLGLEFSRVELPDGGAATLHGTLMQEGKSETGRDAATIGGATAGGAVLGRVLSKKQRDRNTAIGAIVGAGIGTVIASQTEGQEVEIPAGTGLSLQLDRPADVPVRR